MGAPVARKDERSAARSAIPAQERKGDLHWHAFNGGAKAEEAIRLKDVKKIYSADGKAAALNGVSFVVEKREFLIIMGRSGSGKSTMLHMMGCLDTPTEGEVYIGGIKTTDLGPEELARIRREKIGFVFQAFNLVPNLDATRNVALPMMFEGVPKPERERRARELLEMVGLADHVDSYPNEMSGGEKQRVAIARALANDPEIIVADEPTGNLDSVSARQGLEIFDDLHRKRGKTIVVVTHEQYVADMGERMVFMQDGKISESGRIEGKRK